ncbi:MAG: hypothetical protein ABIT70_08440 [Sulfuriferula sp.]
MFGKSAEDLRYECILEALKQMEGGKEEYSKTATPANEPASYGKNQMLIVKILPGLRDIGGTSFTYTYGGKSYTITHADISAAIKRGAAMYDGGSDLLDEANKHNDYKSLTIPARTVTVNGFFAKSGIAAAEWDTWWAQAVGYQKLTQLNNLLAPAYKSALIKSSQGKVLPKYNGNGTINLTTFEKLVKDRGTIPGTVPSVSFWDRLNELLDLAFPHETNRLKAFEVYIRLRKIKAEGYYSFYNRAAYSHPTIPYDAFKYGIADWYKATPAVEEEFIRKTINDVITGKNLDNKILYQDGVERDIAKQAAEKHNGGGPAAVVYAEKFIQIWDGLAWRFTCKDAQGKMVDPRTLFPNSQYAGAERGKTKQLRLDGTN